MRLSFERVSSAVLTIAAVVLVVIVIRREFVQRRNTAAPYSLEPLKVTDVQWKQVLENSIGLDSFQASAPNRLVIFADLECPACARYHQTELKKVRESLRANLAVAYVHLPLSIHRFAIRAAHAAECAYAQGKFDEFLETVFSAQDSIGLAPWSTFAYRSGVADPSRFERCMGSDTVPARVLAGQDLAAELRIRATPTVMVDGWLFRRPLTKDEVLEVIEDLAAGRKPFSD